MEDNINCRSSRLLTALVLTFAGDHYINLLSDVKYLSMVDKYTFFVILGKAAWSHTVYSSLQ